MSSTQPEPEASSDGDGSWTADPQTQDPGEDRSVEAVVARTAARDRDQARHDGSDGSGGSDAG